MLPPHFPFCRFVWLHQLLLAPSTCQTFTALLFASVFTSFLSSQLFRRLWAFLFLVPTVTVEDLLEFSWDVKHLCLGFAVTGSTNISQQKDLDLQSADSCLCKTSFYLFCTDVFHFELNMRPSYVYLIY